MFKSVTSALFFLLLLDEGENLSCYTCIKYTDMSTSRVEIYDFFYPLKELSECPVMKCPEDSHDICVRVTEPYQVDSNAKFDHYFCGQTADNDRIIDQCEVIGITDGSCTYETWNYSPITCPRCSIMSKEQYCLSESNHTLSNATLSWEQQSRYARSRVSQCKRETCDVGITRCRYHETRCGVELRGCYDDGECGERNTCYTPSNPRLCEKLSPCSYACPRCNVSVCGKTSSLQEACDVVSCDMCVMSRDPCHVTAGCASEYTEYDTFRCDKTGMRCMRDQIRAETLKTSDANKQQCCVVSGVRKRMSVVVPLVLFISLISKY